MKSGDKGKLVREKSLRMVTEGHRVEGEFKVERQVHVFKRKSQMMKEKR